jgi:hypothetical protein
MAKVRSRKSFLERHRISLKNMEKSPADAYIQDLSNARPKAVETHAMD